MNILAYKIHKWSEKTANSILSPIDGMNFDCNFLLPITLPLAMFFIHVYDLSEKFFDKESRLIIPTPDLQNIIASEDGYGKWNLPQNEPYSLGIKDPNIVFLKNCWENNREVSYYLLMRGEIPSFYNEFKIPIDKLEYSVSKQIFKYLLEIKKNKKGIELWKCLKFDLRFIK